MDSSGDSESNDSASQEKKSFRIAKDADMGSRNYDNLRTPEGWQDHLISEMFNLAVSELDNTAAAIANLESAYSEEEFQEEKNPYFTFGRERKLPNHDAIYGAWEPVEPRTSTAHDCWEPISLEDVKEEMKTLDSEDGQSQTKARSAEMQIDKKIKSNKNQTHNQENTKKEGKVQKRRSKKKLKRKRKLQEHLEKATS